jgi:hypothetical protein
MQIDQRQVTTLNLHDGRARDLVLLEDGRGYRLSWVSGEDIVHVLLSAQDVHRLRHELAKVDGKDGRKELRPVPEPRPTVEVRESRASMPESYHFQWSTLDWLSFN